MQSGRRSENRMVVRARAAVRNEQRVSRRGRMVCQLRTIRRPIQLGSAFKIWPRLAAKRWHGPDADNFLPRVILRARPESDQRPIGRKCQRPDRRIHQFRHSAARQIVKFSRALLGKPDVRMPIAVGKKSKPREALDSEGRGGEALLFPREVITLFGAGLPSKPAWKFPKSLSSLTLLRLSWRRFWQSGGGALALSAGRGHPRRLPRSKCW